MHVIEKYYHFTNKNNICAFPIQEIKVINGLSNLNIETFLEYLVYHNNNLIVIYII